jgi:hypothetical protein
MANFVAVKPTTKVASTLRNKQRHSHNQTPTTTPTHCQNEQPRYHQANNFSHKFNEWISEYIWTIHYRADNETGEAFSAIVLPANIDMEKKEFFGEN